MCLTSIISGNRGCFRALVACNSQGGDRAKALASSGGAALVGLTIGPAIQLVFNFMGAEGVAIGPLVLSQYTAPALLAITINIATLEHFTSYEPEASTPVPKKYLAIGFFSAVSIKFFLDDSLQIPPKTETDSTLHIVQSEDNGSVCSISHSTLPSFYLSSSGQHSSSADSSTPNGRYCRNYLHGNSVHSHARNFEY